MRPSITGHQKGLEMPALLSGTKEDADKCTNRMINASVWVHKMGVRVLNEHGPLLLPKLLFFLPGARVLGDKQGTPTYTAASLDYLPMLIH